MKKSVGAAPRMPPGARKKEIVETVLGLVATRGIETVSIQVVADKIGLTQPAIFRHFPTKEAMWLAVMDWLEAQLVQIYASEGAADQPALVALVSMFLQHVRLVERHPALAKLVFSDHLRLEYPSLQARFAAVHRAYMARLCQCIDRAKSEGTLPPSLSSRDAASMFLSLIQGLGFQFAIARLPIRLQSEALRLLTLYLRGISADPAAAARALVTGRGRRRDGGPDARVV